MAPTYSNSSSISSRTRSTKKMDKPGVQYRTERKSELQRSSDSAAKSVDSIDEELKPYLREADQSMMDASTMVEMMLSRKQKCLLKAIKMGQEKRKANVELLKERKKFYASKSS